MPYTVQFTDQSPNFTKDSNYNYIFLLAQIRYHNDKLQLKGHVFLNEILDDLGLPRIRRGQIEGWVHEQGIIVMNIEENVWNAHLTLTFNVQGDILSCLPE